MSRLFSSVVLSAPIVVAALAGCNAAPIAPVVQIQPEAPTASDDFEVRVLSRAADPDLEDTVTYDFLWYQGDTEITELQGSQSVDASYTAKNDVWTVVVVPTDSNGTVGQAAQASVTIRNTPPTAEVAIAPAAPGSYEDLVARPEGDDVDGDDVSYRFTWRVDGTVVEELTTNTVPADRTTKGELWTVSVVPSDGQDDGEAVEATVSIGNALPVGVEVTLDPAVAREDTVLTARPVGEDDDDDPLTWTFTWYVNDLALPDIPATQDTLDGASFDVGDRVSVQATPNDGLVDGTPVRSGVVRVRNTPPTLAGAAISPSTAFESTTLTCTGSGYADLDGDPEGYRTVWNVEGLAIESDTLDGSDFSKGDSVFCELYPFDGTDVGELVRTDTLVIEDTPPVLGRVTISDTAPQEGDELSVAVTGASDVDGDTVEFTYSWTVDGTEVATTPTLTSADFDKGDSIQVTVTPVAAGLAGTPVSSAVVTAVNTPPEMTSATLSPSEVRTLDTLTASGAATDADGDAITYDYVWYVDGSAVGATGATLSGEDWFDKNEDVYVVITPNDGDVDGTSLASSAITVQNSLPSLDSVAVSPSSLDEATLATCTPTGWSDDDGDPETYTYAWFVNGTRVGTSATLDGDFFDRGEEVWCEITPTDGEDGTTLTSARVTVGNTAPTLTKVELSTASPKEADTVFAVLIGGDDADGDAITYDYEWYVDGSLVSTADEIGGGDFDKGDSIYVVVTPRDDLDAGTAVTSNVGTVANTAPVLGTITLSPTSPKTLDGVTASVTAADVDAADTVSFAYAWYVEGVRVGSTGATLATSDYAKDEDIYVVVTPTDGDDDGTPVTSRIITAVNSVPSITGVSIVPGTGITESSTLTCTPTGWSDDDGDAEGYAYQWRVDGKLVAITSTLSGTFFSRGDSITCTATPNDGDDLGTPLTASAVSVENTPPTLASVTLSSSSPDEGTTLSATLGTATDPDGDRITFDYDWRVNGTSVSSATTLDGGDFDKGDVIELFVTPTDGTDDGTAVSSGTVTAINTLPVIASVTLSPTGPSTTDAITASVTASDADGDSLSYTYAWTVDGSTVSATGATLATSFFSKDEVVGVTVTPSDGDGSGTAVAASTVTVVNTPPSITGASLSPSSFGEADTVSCVPAGWSDADGDTPGYTYAWKRNGAFLSATTASLDGDDFDRGDAIQCIVTPFDGDDAGTAASTAVVSVDNSLPTLTGVSISPSAATESSTLTAVPGTTGDADGDTVTVKYRWLVGGTEVGVGSTLDGDDFDKGDSVTVEATPFDGTASGTAVTSAAVVVGNTAPVVSSVTLSPSSPDTDDTLTAAYVASDLDGDSLTPTYSWSVNGSAIAATSATLDGGTWFDKGDSVSVSVSVSDGTDSSAAVSSSAVTVRNSPPSLASATVSPSTVREATTVTCVPGGFTDADGDAAVYTYAWTVNGASAGVTTSTLTGASFKKGDLVGCRITPSDGTTAGSTVTSSTVTVLNTAPVLSSVSLSSLTPVEGDTLSVTLGSASDADGDSISYRYAWRVNGTVVASSSTLSSTFFEAGDSITVTVTPTDGTDSGTGVTSSTATVANTAPVVSGISLSPSSPATNDTLTASVSATDADGDALTTTYTWTVDGVTVSGVTGATLSGVSSFDKGELVAVSATVDDGTTSVSSGSTSVTVANTAPRITGATLSPSALAEGDTATCTPSGWSDADGDTPGYVYAWLADGVVISGETGSTLTSGAFSKGETITCRITPDDGDDLGAPVTSGGVTVDNTAPVVSSVSLSDSAPRTDDVLTATASGISDVDGDSVDLTFAWTVGSTVVRTQTTSGTTDTLDGAVAFDKGDTISVTVTPNDGEDDGAAVTSGTATVVNSAPVVSLALAPDPADTSDTLTASVTATDPDGDTLTTTYGWELQDEGAGSFTTLTSIVATLASTEFDRDDVVRATVSVTDGTATTGPLTATATIANALPTEPGSVTLTPDPAADEDDLKCEWTASTDADGDTITYSVDWILDGAVDSTVTPTGLSATLDAADTSPGDTWSCEVIASDGTDQSTAGESGEVEVTGGWDVLVAGAAHSCGIRSGELFCWGNNGAGQLGDNSTTSRSVPTQVGSATDWSTVELGNGHTCGIRASGELYCWGFNNGGRLGDGTTTDRWVPTRVGTSSDWTAVSAGGAHTCAINTSGELYCWGLNFAGGTGSGFGVSPSTPSQVGSATDWDQVVTGSTHTCGLRTTGELYCWGGNGSGQVGDGTTTDRYAVTRVGTATDWDIVSSGEDNTCAINTSGELYCWGDNRFGQVGDSSTTDRDAPTRVGSATDWSVVSGNTTACSVNTSGELFCWGRNSAGQIGDGSTTDRSSPFQIGTATDWAYVRSSSGHTLGLKTDGSGLSWGDNGFGQLGEGTTAGRTSPTAITDP